MNQPATGKQVMGAQVPSDAEFFSVSSEVAPWFAQAMAVPRREGFVDSDGTPIHYFEWGERSAQTVIMAHGYLAHARCFAFIAPLLAQDYHVVAYDLSGMGDSGERSSYPESVRVSELLAVAQATGAYEGADRPVLVAHSYGCTVAFALAQQQPDAFAAWLICDVMMLPPEVLHAFRATNQGPGAGRGVRPHKVYNSLIEGMQRFRLAPEQPLAEQFLWEYMAGHSLRETEEGWCWKFSPSLFAQADERDNDWWQKQAERFLSITGPKALVYGEQSLLCNQQSVDWLRASGGASTQNVPMIGIPQAHHHLMLDQPLAFVAVLRTLLATLPLSAGGNTQVGS